MEFKYELLYARVIGSLCRCHLWTLCLYLKSDVAHNSCKYALENYNEWYSTSLLTTRAHTGVKMGGFVLMVLIWSKTGEWREGEDGSNCEWNRFCFFSLFSFFFVIFNAFVSFSFFLFPFSFFSVWREVHGERDACVLALYI